MARRYFYDANYDDVERWLDSQEEHEPVLMWRHGNKWMAYERDSGTRNFLSDEEHDQAKTDGFTV